jgi:hypothetical protein
VISVRRCRLLAILAIGAAALAAPASAGAFGTINGLGQHAEHEKITKVLSCGAEDAVKPCFESASMGMLAGTDGTVGAVGLPDRVTEVLGNPAAHCDNADYLPDAPYQPSDARRAVRAIDECASLFGRHLDQAVSAAGRLADASRIINSQADATVACPWALTGIAGGNLGSTTAKCQVVEGLGRALHAAEDFWAHSNWADEPDPDQPVGLTNPPGLGRSELVPFLRFPVPRELLPTEAEMLAGTAPITGCDDSADELVNKGWNLVSKIININANHDSCPDRITHSTLNKDKGLIDWKTGETSEPGTPRGQIGDNFQRAVTGARSQAVAIWGDFVTAIDSRYGEARGGLILDALTRDTPWTSCDVSGKSAFASDAPNGSRTALRAVTALVHNGTGKPLTCGSAVLDSGVWSSMPADAIEPGQSASFRTESNIAGVGLNRVRVASGGPEGSASYAIGTTGFTVQVRWSLPIFGSSSYGCEVRRAGAPAPDAPYRCARTGSGGDDSKPTFTVTAR